MIFRTKERLQLACNLTRVVESWGGNENFCGDLLWCFFFPPSPLVVDLCRCQASLEFDAQDKRITKVSDVNVSGG